MHRFKPGAIRPRGGPVFWETIIISRRDLLFCINVLYKLQTFR